MENDLIRRGALLERLAFKRMGSMQRNTYPGLESAIAQVKKAPAVDAVSREVVEQVMWERDTAMEQLKEHGIPFGGIAPDVVKVCRCKDCKRWMKDVPGCTDFVGRCEWANYMVGAAGYCVYGERRDDG